jgi:multicomponent Na+:H+ antiporter subunit E
MSHFALNLVLAIVWMLLFASFTFANFLAGFIAGFFGLVFAQPVLGSRRYVRAVIGIGRLIAVFFYELVVANLQLARDILRPQPDFHPGFVAFDARGLTPSETVLLALMISLTPGTLSVDTDDRGETLYIHSLYTRDLAALQSGFRRFADLIHGAQGYEGSYRRVSSHAH